MEHIKQGTVALVFVIVSLLLDLPWETMASSAMHLLSLSLSNYLFITLQLLKHCTSHITTIHIISPLSLFFFLSLVVVAQLKMKENICTGEQQREMLLISCYVSSVCFGGFFEECECLDLPPQGEINKDIRTVFKWTYLFIMRSVN